MKQIIHLSSRISVRGGDCHRKNLAEPLTNLNAWNKPEERHLCVQGCFITGAGALLVSPLPAVQLQVALAGHLITIYGVEDYFHS